MADHRDDLTGHGVAPRQPEHHEAYQFALVIGADQQFPEEIPRKLTLHGVEVLAVMREWSTLTHRRLVEDARHAPDELVGELDLSDLNALLRRLPDRAARSRFDLLGPPMVVRRHRQCGDLFPFRV